jgi:hypothetical protein
MTRQQREAELHEMLTTQRGKEEILAILKRHAGISDGNLPPFGTLLVDAILNYEYPDGDQEALAPMAARPQEAGDAAFEEPPGREALGG